MGCFCGIGKLKLCKLVPLKRQQISCLFVMYVNYNLLGKIQGNCSKENKELRPCITSTPHKGTEWICGAVYTGKRRYSPAKLRTATFLSLSNMSSVTIVGQKTSMEKYNHHLSLQTGEEPLWNNKQQWPNNNDNTVTTTTNKQSLGCCHFFVCKKLESGNKLSLIPSTRDHQMVLGRKPSLVCKVQRALGKYAWSYWVAKKLMDGEWKWTPPLGSLPSGRFSGTVWSQFDLLAQRAVGRFCTFTLRL